MKELHKMHDKEKKQFDLPSGSDWQGTATQAHKDMGKCWCCQQQQREAGHAAQPRCSCSLTRPPFVCVCRQPPRRTLTAPLASPGLREHKTRAAQQGVMRCPTHR